MRCTLRSVVVVDVAGLPVAAAKLIISRCGYGIVDSWDRMKDTLASTAEKPTKDCGTSAAAGWTAPQDDLLNSAGRAGANCQREGIRWTPSR